MRRILFAILALIFAVPLALFIAFDSKTFYISPDDQLLVDYPFRSWTDECRWELESVNASHLIFAREKLHEISSLEEARALFKNDSGEMGTDGPLGTVFILFSMVGERDPIGYINTPQCPTQFYEVEMYGIRPFQFDVNAYKWPLVTKQ
jgi:hypothetical protein